MKQDDGLVGVRPGGSGGPVRWERLPCDRSRPPTGDFREMTIRPPGFRWASQSWRPSPRLENSGIAARSTSAFSILSITIERHRALTARFMIRRRMPCSPSWMRNPPRIPFLGLCAGEVKGVGQGIDDVAGNHADRAVLVASDVAGQSVHVDSKLCGLESGQPLADQGGDHAGQHIAGPARGHSRVARLVHINSLAVGHNRSRALEHDDERTRVRRPIARHCRCDRPAPPRRRLPSAGRTRPG